MTTANGSHRLNWNSHRLTRGWQKGVRAFYWGLGFSEEDFDKPQVGIGVPLLDGNLCNVHAYRLAESIAAGCRDAGLLGYPFGVPGISDNITQGHEGGNASLPSRNMIANASEAVVSAHAYDALVGMHHCDKNGPGFAMALARLNFPGLIVSGGSILPGCHREQATSILDAYHAHAAEQAGEMDSEEADTVIRTACPGPGGCGIAASFNTWGIAMEAIGLMLPDSSSMPAVEGEKESECRRVGAAVRHLLAHDIRPRDILTPAAFRNATVAMAAAGGSTNGILHLLALAREAGVRFTLRDIQPILRETPVLCSFAPRGTGTMFDLHQLGGTTLLLAHLLRAGLLDGTAPTVTGKTLAENLAGTPEVPVHQPLIAPADTPFKDYADMQICFGNLAPDGIVFKVSDLAEPRFHGPARCFSDTRTLADAASSGVIRPGEVCVLRGLGPVASGMPEVLVASAALTTERLKGKVALISDTRVSGVSSGIIGIHCAPEAAAGGPIALVEDGDEITFDLLAGTITLGIDDDALNRRRRAHQAPTLQHQRTYLADFSATTTQAHLGCVSQHVVEREGGPG